MYEHNVIMAWYILSNCYFITVTVHETTKERVTAPISHSWVNNVGSPIIQVGSLSRSGLMAPKAEIVETIKLKSTPKKGGE